MSKDNKTFDPEDRLIDFAVRIIQVVESLPKTKVGNHIRKLHNWKFLVRPARQCLFIKMVKVKFICAK